MSVVADKYRGSKEYFLVYSELITAARHSGTTTYQAIAQIMGLPLSGSHMGNEIGKILGEISEDEHRYGRPLLSAVAVGVDSRLGKGFFTVAKDLGRLEQDADDETQRQFWQEEKAAVYEAWKMEFGEKE